jgi:outer membrane immunogenic protein
MKRSLLASTALCFALAPGAFAADLPTMKGPPPAPAVAPPAFSWTGFYIGGNVGALWSSDPVETLNGFDAGPPGSTNALNLSGLVGGVEAGYNYQISSFVVGVEGALEASSARGSSTPLFADPAAAHSSSLPFFAELRARAGVAFDRFLPYVTGGVVFADQRNTVASQFFTPLSTGRSEATGWAIGGGVEYAIDNHWSAKAEYLYTQFPNVTGSVVDGPAYAFKFKDSNQLARVGLNYRF